MDEILYLEPDEEITSVIDKLRRSQGGRVSLVVPRGATLLQSVINLKLLDKEAANLNKEISIITADKIGRNLAAQVGLQVFDSVKNPKPVYEPPRPNLENQEILEINDQKVTEEANPNVHHFQKTPSSSLPIRRTFDNDKDQPSPVIGVSKPSKIKVRKPVNWGRFKKISLPIVIIVLAVAVLGAYYALPLVNIDIKVLAEPFQKSAEMKVSGTAATDPAVFTGQYFEVSKNKDGKFITTGQKNLGGKASGTITIYNGLDSNTHYFRAGTKLSSSSKTFILQSAVTVPGATVQNLRIVPGTVNANIQADQPGSDYNVTAGRFTIVDLPASEQEAIYGQSSSALAGGFSKVVQVVSQEDFDKAKNQLSSELTDEINQEIQKEAQNLKIIDKSIRYNQTDIKSSANVGDQANDFNLHLYLTGQVVAFSGDEFNKFVLSRMEQDFPPDKMISLGPEDSISPVVKETIYDQKMLLLDVAVTGKLSTKLDVTQLKNDLLGKNKSEATNLLSSLKGVQGTDINYSPSLWFKGVPRFSKSVSVRLDYVLGDNQAIDGATKEPN